MHVHEKYHCVYVSLFYRPSPIGTKAPPAQLITSPGKLKRSISQHLCYHGTMTGICAEEKFKKEFGNCYLVRYSNTHKEYMLSVCGRGDNNDKIIQHFTIKIIPKYDQNEYEIEGSEKKFDDFSELLQYYEKNPISYEIYYIGKPLCKLNQLKSHTFARFMEPSETYPSPKNVGAHFPGIMRTPLGSKKGKQGRFYVGLVWF